jgi:hypothetical protein
LNNRLAKQTIWQFLDNVVLDTIIIVMIMDSIKHGRIRCRMLYVFLGENRSIQFIMQKWIKIKGNINNDTKTRQYGISWSIGFACTDSIKQSLPFSCYFIVSRAFAGSFYFRLLDYSSLFWTVVIKKKIMPMAPSTS